MWMKVRVATTFVGAHLPDGRVVDAIGGSIEPPR
jgi:hypothetical protein